MNGSVSSSTYFVKAVSHTVDAQDVGGTVPAHKITTPTPQYNPMCFGGTFPLAWVAAINGVIFFNHKRCTDDFTQGRLDL